MKDKADDSEIEEIFENNQGVFYKEFPIYVSFPDKINYLFAKILKSYSRDVKKDKDILLFCGKLRNTLHNNGINWKGNEEIEIEGHIFKFWVGSGYQFLGSRGCVIFLLTGFSSKVEILTPTCVRACYIVSVTSDSLQIYGLCSPPGSSVQGIL